jgi:putative heme-binding domain-containing protein
MHSLPVPWPELLTLVELLSTTIVRKIPRNGSITHTLDNRSWIHLFYSVPALGSPHHLVREKAAQMLVKRGQGAVAKLANQAAKSKEPLGAAGALWVLTRIGTPEAKEALAAGTKHSDYRVRRLAIHLMRRFKAPRTDEVARELGKDDDPAVQVEAALALGDATEVRRALLAALEAGAAKDDHLRYEGAWHLARHADETTLSRLLSSKDENIRLAGLIAVDVACFEGFSSKPVALAALKRLLGEPDKSDLDLLLTLARMNRDGSLAPVVQKLLSRSDAPAATTARALLLLRSHSAEVPAGVLAAAGKRLLEALDKGAVRINSPAEAALLLEVLECEGPTEKSLSHLKKQLESGHGSVRPAAHALARRFGFKAASLAAALWKRLGNAGTPIEERLEVLATLARIEPKPDKERWRPLLSDSRPAVATEVLRAWRSFKGQPEMVKTLIEAAPALLEKRPALADDLAVVLTHLEAGPAVMKKLGLMHPDQDRDALARETLKSLAGLNGNERRTRAVAGRLVFERSACVKCHTTVDRDTPLAPSLKGVSRGQKPDYLVESVLFPSKVIKTGFETERVTTKSGKVLTGLVKDDGKSLRILNADSEVRLSKSDVESREVQKVSLMPEGQEKLISRQEFLDLIVYLASLR